ncbi:CYTH domain-containing protein [Candidatus Magnetaquicoccus inordinatus]|uniref:CYTH domain-containing protein n=1 Tax=Candidatus Magnetaquicoccus inordinatus TaxID=2496818 RepID=UPI00187D5522|nr:CYTH domain-containing protein [Candidatus Magnetaquicoccus inordinatus]
MAIEEEIKLTAASALVLDTVAQDGALLAKCQGTPIKTRHFLATYYDTPERHLLQNHLAFRMRQEQGGGLRANLKGTGGPMVAGLAQRQEWEEMLSTPIAHWEELPAGEMRERILAAVDPQAALVPLFVTDFQRRVLLLQWEENRVEMALDQGEIRTDTQIHPLAEVELERLAGQGEAIRALADDLMQRYPLTYSQRSKFGLGLALLGLDAEI